MLDFLKTNPPPPPPPRARAPATLCEFATDLVKEELEGVMGYDTTQSWAAKGVLAQAAYGLIRKVGGPCAFIHSPSALSQENVDYCGGAGRGRGPACNPVAGLRVYGMCPRGDARRVVQIYRSTVGIADSVASPLAKVCLADSASALSPILSHGNDFCVSFAFSAMGAQMFASSAPDGVHLRCPGMR